MSRIPSRRSGLWVVAALLAVGCQSSKKRETPAPVADAAVAKTGPGQVKAVQAEARKRCSAAADRYAADPSTGTEMLATCAAMFGDPSCRGALEKAAASPSVEAGMAAIQTCKLAYCPTYTLAELCESKAPPTVMDARAKFPRLAAEVLAAEHGKSELGTLDSVAYLAIKPLLPRQRAVYIRARKKGGAVELAIGEQGWTECKTDRTVTVGKGADLRDLGGPLLKPLVGVAKGVEPALVEALVDPDEGARVLEVATAAGRFLQGRGMEVVVCRNKRRNCPGLEKCP